MFEIFSWQATTVVNCHYKAPYLILMRTTFYAHLFAMLSKDTLDVADVISGAITATRPILFQWRSKIKKISFRYLIVVPLDFYNKMFLPYKWFRYIYIV